MTQSEPLTHSDSQSAPPSTQASASATPVVGHQTPGLVVIPQTAEGAVVGMLSLGADGVTSPLELTHSESGQPLLWADVACSNKVAAVSGWFPGKLGGWVKLDWRDGGFAADAWSSDGAGMTAYDAAMRAAKKRA